MHGSGQAARQPEVSQPVSGGGYCQWGVVVVSGSKYWSFGVAHHGTNVSAWSSYGFAGLGLTASVVGWGWGHKYLEVPE